MLKARLSRFLYPTRLFLRDLQIPTAKFKGSNIFTKSDLDAFAVCFDKGLKGNFSEGSRAKFVKFGSPRENDSRRDVKDGQLKLQGYANFFNAQSHKRHSFLPLTITAALRAQVVKFFKPSVDAVLEAVKGIANDLDPANTVTM